MLLERVTLPFVGSNPYQGKTSHITHYWMLYYHISYIKTALSALKQFCATENNLKMMKNAFISR